MSQQEPVVDQLLSVIRDIQRERQTGVLNAQRGEGAAREEGSITFERGQVVQAKGGRRTGTEALNWLSTWRNCHYRFIPSVGSHSSQQAAQQRTEPAIQPGTPPPTRPASSINRQPIQPENVALSSIIPYRTGQLEEALRIIEAQRLSRTHRHLLLLIDGQRSIQELVHVLKRNEQEVIHLLRDLQNASLIDMSRKATRQ